MFHKRPPIPVIVLLVLAVLAGVYFGIRALLNKPAASLTASGTIEAVEVTISPEAGGKVATVLVEEGALVKAGDELFHMDDTLLLTQRTASAASLDLVRAAVQTAQAQYDLVVDSAHITTAASRTAGWHALQPSGYTLPGWYFGSAEELAAVQAEVETAKLARDTARSKLDGLVSAAPAADFVAAENRLLDARTTFLVARDVLTRANAANENADLQPAAQNSFDAAQTGLEDAQAAYDDLNDSDAANNIISARAELSAVQERYDSARDRLLALQTGENSPQVTAAAAVLNQAQTAVTQAEAALALFDVQMGKLTVKAPADGVILTRSIEPGEVVAAGAVALTLGRLEALTITVYVPEERYGEISLNQSASVAVDSFPGETFTASVVHIADQAEFTPRNVQTVEGRTSTVFAIKLQVQDPNGKLKPGMPADVTFH